MGGEKGKVMIGALVHALVHGTACQMLDAADAIGNCGEGVVLAVAPLLRSVHRETRWRAAIVLEGIGSPSVEALVLAAADRDWHIRTPAIWALDHIGDQRSMPALMQNLHGATECCRWMAAAALHRLGDEAIGLPGNEVLAPPIVPSVIEGTQGS